MNQKKNRFASLEAAEAALRAYVPAVKEITGKDITLERMLPLMAALDNPQDKLKIVHVAGTSGKTSTAYYVARMLQAPGRKIGLTVSPHIDSVTERVQINLRPLNEWDFADALGEFLNIVDTVWPQPSYFELLVAFVYWYFAKAGVDIAVIETGFGGMHDGTNVAQQQEKVCVVTDIGLDHTHILGDTVELIAAQKAGIIHPQNTVIMYEQQKSVMEVFAEHSAKVEALLFTQNQNTLRGRYDIVGLKNLPMYQQRNWLLAREACEKVVEKFALVLDKDSIGASLNIQVPGRMDVFERDGLTLVMDGAHNEQKIQAFVDSFSQKYPGKKATLLLSLKKDKEYKKVLPLLRQIADTIIVTTFDAMQDLPVTSLDATELAKAAREAGFDTVHEIADAREAYKKLLGSSNGLVVITGSFYLVALVRLYIRQRTVRAIAAIDDNRGLASNEGIPWHLPTDRAYTRDKTMGGALLMGYNTYLEFDSPRTGRLNLVLTDGTQVLREGFDPVTDVASFMKNSPDSLWLFGGAGAFEQTIAYADELYLTRVEGDFDCTKFFPEFESRFELIDKSRRRIENETAFRFELWRRKALK